MALKALRGLPKNRAFQQDWVGRRGFVNLTGRDLADLVLHRAGELLVRQRTMLINALRGHCGEFGIVVAQGSSKVTALIEMIEESEDERLPTQAREALESLVDQFRMVQAQILGLEKKLMVWHRANEASRRLETIPGVGIITATALVAAIGDASQFHSDRQLAAWAWAGSRTALQRRQGTGRSNIEERRRYFTAR